MQQATPFDEFAQAETLQAVGFKADQAREIVRVAASIKTEHLATREQVTKVEAGLNSRIDRVRSDLKEDMHKLESRLATKINKNIWGAFAALAVVMELLRFFHF